MDLKKKNHGKSSLTESDAEWWCFSPQSTGATSASGLEAAPSWVRFPSLQATAQQGRQANEGTCMRGPFLYYPRWVAATAKQTIYRTKACTLLPCSPSQGQSPTPPPSEEKWIIMKLKSGEKMISSLKSWAVRMPNNLVVWKPQSMQRNELLKINISLCSVLFRRKSQQKAAHHSFCYSRNHVHV